MPFFFSANCLIFTPISRNSTDSLIMKKRAIIVFLFGFSDIAIDGNIDREREKKHINTYHSSHSLCDYRCEITIGEKG